MKSREVLHRMDLLMVRESDKEWEFINRPGPKHYQKCLIPAKLGLKASVYLRKVDADESPVVKENLPEVLVHSSDEIDYLVTGRRMGKFGDRLVDHGEGDLVYQTAGTRHGPLTALRDLFYVVIFTPAFDYSTKGEIPGPTMKTVVVHERDKNWTRPTDWDPGIEMKCLMAREDGRRASVFLRRLNAQDYAKRASGHIEESDGDKIEYVLNGQYTYEVHGKEIALNKGDLVYLPNGLRHALKFVSHDSLTLVYYIPPFDPYRVS